MIYVNNRKIYGGTYFSREKIIKNTFIFIFVNGKCMLTFEVTLILLCLISFFICSIKCMLLTSSYACANFTSTKVKVGGRRDRKINSVCVCV